VLVLALVAVLIRIKTAFAGGIWADEGFFLLVVQSPSFREMVDFLHYHESHPPLFYAVVRIWMLVFGNTDTSVRLLCALLGAGIIPAVYVTGRRLFSKRAALLAVLLVIVSPALNEHSTQIRPYGMMALLVLASCFSMLRAIERGRRSDWAIYVASTLLLLYVHNWAWLVVIGQHSAMIVHLFGRRKAQFKPLAVAWLYSWLVIVTGFLPWLSAFLYQVRNAGHAGVPLHGVVDAIELLVFGIFSSAQTLFFGRIVHPAIVALVGMAAAIACAVVGAQILRNRTARTRHDARDDFGSSAETSRVRFVTLTIVVGMAIVAAIVLTPRSNQLLARCISTLIPLVALAAGYWIDSQWTRATAPHFRPIVAASAMTFVMTAAVIDLLGIIDARRSNAREVAIGIRNNMNASDLVIVAPEWFAPSFNHYFPPSIEQIDFPYPARSGLIDFSGVWNRVADLDKLSQLERRIVNTSSGGRRVWLVSEDRYLHGVDADALREAEVRKDPAPYAMLRTGQIRTALERLYGKPDSSRVANDPALYDNLRVFLYSRAASDDVSQR
jgi:4-amino-4-deoxy-L-arabinose transferase-like glycosyltransferase